MQQYGYFDVEKQEYVIKTPKTPLPWINYLGSQEFFGLISNTAGGYCFYKDPRERRILRYRYNNSEYDSGGRYLYLRENKTGEFWSPTWQPVKRDLDDYECRHGLGYTQIIGQFRQILSDITYFVPVDDNLEVWSVTLTNLSDQARDLQLFSYVEFCLWNALDDQTNFQRNLNLAEVEVDNGVIYHKTEYRERRNHFAYFACDQPVSGFETQRQTFLGAYGQLSAPLVVQKGESSNSIAHGWAPIGSHQIEFTLQPGEKKELTFLLGYGENSPENKFNFDGSLNKEQVSKKIELYFTPLTIAEKLAELQVYWANLLNKFTVKSPDDKLDLMVNTWNQYQCMTTFNLSRSASYYESGIGRGMGFRDSNQDILGFVHQIPERVKERLFDLASTQFVAGHTYHQYSPLTKSGNHDIGSGYNDDPLWLVIAVAEYIKETGDLDFLKTPTPFENDPAKSEPLYNHLERSLEFILNNLGPHGLPLIGYADWNDCLNLNWETKNDGQVAESVMIAEMFIYAAKELKELATHIKKEVDVLRLEEVIAKMSDNLNKFAWDGDWYLRAFDDHGQSVGSHKCPAGKIFLEPQPWAVMAGAAPKERAQRCMDAVYEHLYSEHGIILLQPAYNQYSGRLGEISTYPPGVKENAGIFCHPNPWAVIAECILGRGERAFQYYQTICPTYRQEISQRHRAEPYVYSQMIAGPDHANFGEAKNSWLTGTASWNFVAVSRWILGIRPSYDGLIIDPCIPAAWPGFTVIRQFRGATYEIQVSNPHCLNRGITELRMNGELLIGNKILLQPKGSYQRVEAIIGG